MRFEFWNLITEMYEFRQISINMVATLCVNNALQIHLIGKSMKPYFCIKYNFFHMPF